MSSNRDQFTSKIGFILAAAGSAIGLGAIWKFPYTVGTNGGSVFILLFILCTLLIGLPILMSEFLIGRRSQADAVSAFKKEAPGKPWFLAGWLGVIVSALILSFYGVVGGWILSYLFRAVTFQLNGGSEEHYGELFSSLIANPWEVIFAQAMFMFITIFIVQSGIKGGIERAGKWMMPALFIFFILLAIRSLTLDGAMEGVKFMFVPDWSYLNMETLLNALGLAFFSLSVGVGAMITYASYLPKTETITSSAFNVAWMNIAISILAGLVIFPAVFALGYSPAQGPGLVFIILPAVFEQIPMGSVLIIIFFILLLFATLTSSISLLEITVSVFVKDNYEKRRSRAWIVGLVIFLAGIPSALSFGVWSNIFIMDKSIFDFIDYITANVGMPIGALAFSLFVAYYYKTNVTKAELNLPNAGYWLWRTIVCVIAPIAIITISLYNLFA